MIAETNISLKVPFNEKDQAKALGARWNAEAKQWFVPQGLDSAPFEKWFTDSATTIPMNVASKATTQKLTEQAIDDMDAINARLRDAYELREMDN